MNGRTDPLIEVLILPKKAVSERETRSKRAERSHREQNTVSGLVFSYLPSLSTVKRFCCIHQLIGIFSFEQLRSNLQFHTSNELCFVYISFQTSIAKDISLISIEPCFLLFSHRSSPPTYLERKRSVVGELQIHIILHAHDLIII